MIALTTTLAAFVAILESDAANKTAQAIRQSQQYAIQAIGIKASGEMQAGYAWAEAYRHWLEWDTLAFIAENEGDPDAAERYRVVRDRAATLSPLLKDPYFDPAADEFPNVRAYEATTYLVETTLLTERFINAMELAGNLEDKEKAYGTQLLLLAVCLFLYGLSTTIIGRMNWLFIGIGTLIAFGALVWTITTFTTPVTVFPDEAIVNYSRGVGLAHQDDFTGAIDAFDQALAAVPDYANVYYERADAYYELRQFDKAASDYEAALEAGREDVNVLWNLGWTYYVQGRFEDAISTTQAALEQAPEQIALHFNLGLAYLASGQIEAARQAYADGINLAKEQVSFARAMDEEPPASLWWYLNTASIDLDSLLRCLLDQVCIEAPPYQSIMAASNVAPLPEARDLRLELKGLSVALEHTGHSPTTLVGAEISGVEFASPLYNENEEVVGYAALATQDNQLRFGRVQDEQGETMETSITRASPEEASEVFVLFDYAGMQDGQLFTMKIYNNGEEAAGLRLVDEWLLGSDGEAALPLTPGRQFALAAGDYRVEIYIDGNLIQESSFTIENP
jgi:tetratricopeptide (TPR) repeat protein